MDETKWLEGKKRATENRNYQRIADYSKRLGEMYQKCDRLEEALAEYEDGLRACTILKNNVECVIAHKMIGEVLSGLGSHEEALTHQILYLKGARGFGDLFDQQKALAAIGSSYVCIGETLYERGGGKEDMFLAAEKAYRQSLRVAHRLESTEVGHVESLQLKVGTMLNLGLVLEQRKRIQFALMLIKSAAEICQKHGFDEDLHRTYIALGAVYERQNMFDVAQSYVEMAIKTGDSDLRAVARLTKAELLLRLGHWNEAGEILTSLYGSNELQPTILGQAETLLRILMAICRDEMRLASSTNRASRQMFRKKLGDASAAVQAYDKAVEFYSLMLRSAENNSSREEAVDALVRIVKTYREAKRYDDAVIFARLELRLYTEPTDICRCILHLADLLDLSTLDKSSIPELYDQALKIARDNDDRTLEVTILRHVNAYYEANENFAEANATKRKIDELWYAIVDDSSDDESWESTIGDDVSLEDLPDCETATSLNNNTDVYSGKTEKSKRGIVKRNEKGETKLHVACANGIIDDVEELLAAGHPVNVRDNVGSTPLHAAVNGGHVKIVERLIVHGANVNDPGNCKIINDDDDSPEPVPKKIKKRSRSQTSVSSKKN